VSKHELEQRPTACQCLAASVFSLPWHDLVVTPLSILDLSPIVEGGTARDALRNSLDLACAAERLGYRRYWVAEHHNMDGVASSATAVLVGQIAAHARSRLLRSASRAVPPSTMDERSRMERGMRGASELMRAIVPRHAGVRCGQSAANSIRAVPGPSASTNPSTLVTRPTRV
jgi:Luciferase-like monooxygenase